MSYCLILIYFGFKCAILGAILEHIDTYYRENLFNSMHDQTSQHNDRIVSTQFDSDLNVLVNVGTLLSFQSSLFSVEIKIVLTNKCFFIHLLEGSFCLSKPFDGLLLMLLMYQQSPHTQYTGNLHASIRSNSCNQA